MKLRNKLILSCAALAAVATTAVSTTYAWYTSNDKVTVGTLTANTKNSGADLLMIADGQKATSTTVGDVTTTTVSDVALSALAWNTEILNITTNAMDSSTGSNANMIPLAYNATNVADGTNKGALVQLTQTGTGDEAKMVTASGTTDSSTGYLYFVLYLKNAGSEARTINMHINNLRNNAANAAALPSKSILNPEENRKYMGLTSGNTYTVDALRVAAVDVEYTPVDNGTLANAVEKEVVYNLSSSLASPSFIGSANPLGASYSAHDYYNAVMSVKLDKTDTYNVDTSEFTSLGAASGVNLPVQLPAANSEDDYYRLAFKVFLNGWDKSCFDACQGQQFTFDLDFTVVRP